MATITLSTSKEFDVMRKKFPEINWNAVLKNRILKKLAELKKFEELKKKGRI